MPANIPGAHSRCSGDFQCDEARGDVALEACLATEGFALPKGEAVPATLAAWDALLAS